MIKHSSPLAPFFYPRNIVVIGVSPDQTNLGKSIVLNCLTLGFQGEILSVGLKQGVAFGQRIYQSLEEIDRDVDLAVILTPARTIPGILDQCGRKGIKHAVIESGGFSELGEEGKPLERACQAAARQHGIRFIGPNGIGVINLEVGLAIPFTPLRRDLTSGPVSILAQSGGVGLSYLNFLADENIGINKFVSMGNKLNVDENDLLSYLIDDKGTKIILIYLEGFTDGRRFVEIASKAEKPILVHKSNRFEQSARIAHSHTTALFTDDRLVDYALEQAGCIRLNTLDDAMDYVKSQALPPLRGNRLAVVSRSGGHAVIAADACAYYGFRLAQLPDEFLRKIESRFRAHVIRLQNPLDLGDLFELEFYEYIVEEMLKREDLDGILLGHGYRRGFEQETSRELFKKVERLVEQYRKPVATFVLTEAVEMDYLKKHVKIPVFSTPENAMRALSLSHRWAARKAPTRKIRSLQNIDKISTANVLAAASGPAASGRDELLLSESMKLLEFYGFSFPPYGLATSSAEALKMWKASKGPVAMKINRPHISHKTDRGAVRLNLDSKEELEEAFEGFLSLGGKETEVMVQAMANPGKEVILGGKRDPCFGPIVLFGLGGIFVEALEDVVWRIAPFSDDEARHMIESIKGAKLLRGVRGDKPCDIGAITDLLVRLSQMLVDHPAIQEMDINPVMVFQEGLGAQAVDARIILGKNTEIGPQSR
jgi:acyl-CoA synthetase (NDP forming)